MLPKTPRRGPLKRNPENFRTKGNAPMNPRLDFEAGVLILTPSPHENHDTSPNREFTPRQTESVSQELFYPPQSKNTKPLLRRKS